MKSLILIIAALASTTATARPADFEARLASTADRLFMAGIVPPEKALTSIINSRVTAPEHSLTSRTVITITEDIPEGGDAGQLANGNDPDKEKMPEIKRNRRQHSFDEADQKWLFLFPLPQNRPDSRNNLSF